MPSPLGHALAGLATAWLGDLMPGNRRWRVPEVGADWWERGGGALSLCCAALGAAPDLDLLVGAHRTVTHSLTAAASVGVMAMCVAAVINRPALRTGAMCAGAYASHLLLDLVGVDNSPPRGIDLLWPFSQRFVITEWNIFPSTERRHLLSLATWLTNLRAAATELALLLPVLALIWMAREHSLASLRQSFRRETPRKSLDCRSRG